jgi:4-carboxymuconolactone decarboxylase
MTRLPAIPRTHLDADQQLVWDAVTGGRRASAHRDSGGLVDDRDTLIGPFNAWLYNSHIGLRAAELGEAVRFDSVLERPLQELAILTVAAHWRSNFEVWAHRRYAIDAGVANDVVDAVVAGELPGSADSDERLVIATCHELLATGTISDERFEAVRDQLGDVGVVDLVTTVGYYTMVAFNLNAFRIDVPPGEAVTWEQ